MKNVFLVLAFVLGLLNLKAQDPVFYNTNQSLIYLNPSFAGSNGGIRNQTSGRLQSAESGYSCTTLLNTFDIYLKALKGGLALSFMHDAVYGINSNIISLSYAQHIKILGGKLKIIPSFQFSFGQRMCNSLMFIGENYDPRYGLSESNPPTNFSMSKSYFDLSSGLLINYQNKFYIGASYFHINQAEIGIYGTKKLPFDIKTHVSYNFKFSEKCNLQAIYLVDIQNQIGTHRLALNLLSFEHFISGFALVNWETPVFSLGFRTNYFNLLFSYDYTVNKLIEHTHGSYEVHASFNLRNKEQRNAITSFEAW